jgi:hypothetical protein
MWQRLSLVINKYIFSTPMFKTLSIAYVSMTLSDTLTSCDFVSFVRFSHEVKLATGFLVTLCFFFNSKNHVTLKMKLVVTCQLTFIRFEFYV